VFEASGSYNSSWSNCSFPTEGGEGGTRCKFPGDNIRAKLSSPIELAPVSFPSPLDVFTPTCAEVTESRWVAENFTYHAQWNAVIGGGGGASTIFQVGVVITNKALNYTARCLISYRLNALAELPTRGEFDCSPESRKVFSRPPKYEIDTYFGYDINSGKLDINQTWYCLQQNNLV
jgi:hypothetical protein